MLNCAPSELTAHIQAPKTRAKMIATKGVLIAIVPKNIRRDWWKTEPPDLPSLEPTPSIAAFPFNLLSALRGMKAISFVISKKVNLLALDKIFCIAPKNTHRARGVHPKKRLADSTRGWFFQRRVTKKSIPETNRMIGVR